jgi:hypothetical protein
VDTPKSSETILNTALTALRKQTNRTLVTSAAKAAYIQEIYGTAEPVPFVQIVVPHPLHVLFRSNTS